MATDETLQLKLMSIGDSGVGKSWLLLRWATPADKFDKQVKSAGSTATIGIDFKNKNVDIDGQKVKLQIWDTAGQERYHTLTVSYYKKSQGILLVYDVTNRESFENTRKWMQQIVLNADASVNKVLIGNKCDLSDRRVISYIEGSNLASEFGIPFFETSAMSNVNVEKAFLALATACKRRVTALKVEADRAIKPTASIMLDNAMRVENMKNPQKKKSSMC